MNGQNKKPVIAIAGATGVVGNEVLRVLEERKIAHSEIHLLASEDSAGELYAVQGAELEVEELEADSFRGVDYALFALSDDLAAQYIPHALEAGVIVIDTSSHSRSDENTPVVIPEVNGGVLSQEVNLFANPSAATAQLVPVLHALHEAAGLKRVVLSTYQAVSEVGKVALDELWEQTRAIFTQKAVESEAFQHQIAFNCIPQIDVMLDDGSSKEEKRIVEESRKLLALPELPMTVTAVRVPVFHSHGQSVNIETEKKLTREEALKVLEDASGIEVFHHFDEYPLQIDAATRDEIFVGRVREDESVKNGLNLWIVADNLRKGAALNAVQILEELQTLRSDAA